MAVKSKYITSLLPWQSKMATPSRIWGSFAEDDITRLPTDYEARVTDDDRVYFVK